MSFNKTFLTLLEEGQFTSEILANGVTQLGKVNYAKKGIYFSSFTSISTGLERIGKLCLILDFYINNNGEFPSENILKKDIGHNLEKLYEKTKPIIKKHNIKFSFINNLEDEIYKDILKILSNFAKGDRYSNINYLVKSNFQSDPIYDWNTKIDKILFEKRVSKSKKDKILFNARIIGKLMNEFTSVSFTSESREDINDVENSSYLTGVNNSVAKYRQLYVLQIIRYWVEILRHLQYKAMDLGKFEIPFFNELFSIFYNEDSYLLSRKTFDKL